jgi:DNA-directed RNA polymerase alpha subunit
MGVLLPTQVADIADGLGAVADRMGVVLAEGEMDDESRETLARIARALHQTAAGLDDIAFPQPFPEAAVEVEIGELYLSVRTYNALARAGIKTVGELQRLFDSREVLGVRGVGSATLGDIEQALERFQRGTMA